MKNMKNKFNSIHISIFITSILFLGMQNVWAQDDLMALLDDNKDTKEDVTAVFKGARLILGHSTKTRKQGELELLISHRFGRINSGSHELWGLDNSSVRIGLEYGITDKLNVGIGRSSFDKSFDGFLKYKVLTQSKGKGGAPVSLTLLSSLAIRTTPKQEFDSTYDQFKERLAYTYQLLISKKINSKLSFQMAPTFVNRNRPVDLTDEDQIIALGLGGRYKLSGSVTFNIEYYPRLNQESNSTEYNSIAMGVDIETGGHVFQLHLTNSQMTFERAFITETFDDFFNGDIHFGFNISRTFQLKK